MPLEVTATSIETNVSNGEQMGWCHRTHRPNVWPMEHAESEHQPMTTKQVERSILWAAFLAVLFGVWFVYGFNAAMLFAAGAFVGAFLTAMGT